MIVDYFALKIQEFSRHFTPNFPPSVVSAATIYFQRYYLSKSVMGLSPDSIMQLCLFTACKTEEVNIKISDFARVFPSPQDTIQFIRENEAIFGEAISFHYVVHNTFRPLTGLILQFFEISKEGAALMTQPDLKALCEKALFTWLLSDLIYLHPPSQIALAALYHRTRSLPLAVHVDAFLVAMHKSSHSPVPLEEMIERLKAIALIGDAVVLQSSRPEVGHVSLASFIDRWMDCFAIFL